jgi:colicin import membrane protein
MQRLTERGELSAPQARVLVKVVSKRMQRAASPRERNDQVRLAVARALHEKRATSKRGRSRVAARLRAGLDRWALEQLFAPSAASMARCAHQFKLSPNLCDALAAAATKESPALRTRPPTARELAAQARAQAAAERTSKVELARERRADKRDKAKAARLSAKLRKQAAAQARAEAKRARLDAERQQREQLAAARAQQVRERREAKLREREKVAAARAQRERERQEAIANKRAAVERAQRERREAIAREREQVEIARRKAEYQKQRLAYLERQRQQLAERKQRVVAAVAGEKVERGPTSRLEAQLIGMAPEDDQVAPADTISRSKGRKGRAPKQAAHAANQQQARLETAGGLDMVDALVADEPASKPVARR